MGNDVNDFFLTRLSSMSERLSMMSMHSNPDEDSDTGDDHHVHQPLQQQQAKHSLGQGEFPQPLSQQVLAKKAVEDSSRHNSGHNFNHDDNRGQKQNQCHIDKHASGRVSVNECTQMEQMLECLDTLDADLNGVNVTDSGIGIELDKPDNCLRREQHQLQPQQPHQPPQPPPQEEKGNVVHPNLEELHAMIGDGGYPDEGDISNDDEDNSISEGVDKLELHSTHHSPLHSIQPGRSGSNSGLATFDMDGSARSLCHLLTEIDEACETARMSLAAAGLATMSGPLRHSLEKQDSLNKFLAEQQAP